jgi:hypothetical protein
MSVFQITAALRFDEAMNVSYNKPVLNPSRDQNVINSESDTVKGNI